MKCSDCSYIDAGGQHDYGANGLIEFAHDFLQVGRAYPAQDDGLVPFKFQNTGREKLDLPLLHLPDESKRKGWICPKCDAGVSPDEKTCPYCKPFPKKENADGNLTRITETD